MATGKNTTLKSCEGCRTAKAKCVPSPDPNVNDCLRCIKHNKQCIYQEARPRPKRGPQAHTRVAEMEKKINDIHSLLQSNHQDTRSTTVDSHPTENTPNIIPRTSGSPFALQNPGHVPLSVRSEPCRAHRHRDRDAIDKEILSEKEADELLRVYRVASQDFPFVYVGDASLAILRQDKPFLLLSILTMSSQRARSLQILLEKELRETLASKVIVEGELSLDVLQGLMIYLAWYHHNFRPCRQQIYQLTQLCGSMIVDLELHRPDDTSPGFVLHPSKACMACKKDTAEAISSKVEAMRTYIGAYYLTTSISLMLRKPNGMNYSPYIRQCCDELAQTEEAPMDRYLIYYVRSIHVAEEISNTFGYCQPNPDLSLSYTRIQGTVRAFIANIDSITKDVAPEVYSMPSIMSVLHTTPNLAYEIILHLDAYEQCSPVSSPNNSSPRCTSAIQSWHTSTIRTSMLLSALESITTCLDWYISLLPSDFERFNLLDMSRISYHLLLLSRLTVSGTPGSTISTLTEQKDMLMRYFNGFLAKYEELARIQMVEEKKSIYFHMSRIFSTSRDWLERMVEERIARVKNGEENAAGDAVHVQPNFHFISPMGIVDLDKEKVEALGRGFTVAAAAETFGGHQHNHSHSTNGQHTGHVVGRPGKMSAGRAWQAAMAALPGTGIEGSVLF